MRAHSHGYKQMVMEKPVMEKPASRPSHLPHSVDDLIRMNRKVSSWGLDHVRMWLESIGLTIYWPIFEAASITGEDLLSFNTDLEALRVRVGVISFADGGANRNRVP